MHSTHNHRFRLASAMILLQKPSIPELDSVSLQLGTRGVVRTVVLDFSHIQETNLCEDHHTGLKNFT